MSSDFALEANNWETDEAAYEELADAYAALSTEARLQRESEWEAHCLDMLDLPPWPTAEEIAEFEAEWRARNVA